MHAASTEQRPPSNASEASPRQTPDWPEHLPWAVARVKSRQEKALAKQLEAAGCWHFLPLGRSVRYYAHRRRVTEQPLFPGYVFLRAHREDLFKADRTGRIAQLLPVPDPAQLERELADLWRACAAGMSLTPAGHLTPGTPVVVRRGPLRGVRGTVYRDGREGQLVLHVSMVNGAAELEIDPSFLEREEPTSERPQPPQQARR
jgi:transcription antitermination factor NusG